MKVLKRKTQRNVIRFKVSSFVSLYSKKKNHKQKKTQNNATACGPQIHVKFKIHINEVVLDSTRRLIRPRAASVLLVRRRRRLRRWLRTQVCDI